MFRKLRVKLTLYMAVVLALFLAFTAAGIYNFTKYIFEDGTRKNMQAQAVRIYAYNDSYLSEQNNIYKDGLFTVAPKLALAGAERLKVSYVTYNEAFEIVSSDDDMNIAEYISDLAVDSYCMRTDSYEVRKINGTAYRIYTKYFNNDQDKPKIVQVYQDTISEEIIWSFLKTVLLLFGSMGMVVMLALSYYFTGKALEPVKEAWIKQKEFVADASHELRTPLTVIQTNLDVVMSDEEGTVEENDMWLDNAYSETRVMAKLIDQLLTLAKADANEGKLEISEISLSEIVQDVCDNMTMIAANKKIDFEYDLEENIEIKGDYDKVRRLVVILIDNAIKYTEIGKVTVKLYSEKNKKVLSVEDTGIGIHENDLERIFDRFYRADKARHRQGGTGLGLSIAKWIADAHRAIIDVESKFNEGSKFTVRF